MGDGSKFSAALKLGDLNDFIAPSQSCVVSLNGIKNSAKDFSVQIQKKIPSKFEQAIASTKTDPVKVTLNDCLACSGCVTSAETVMLEQQSVDEVLSHLSSQEKTVIVSLSPQSRASLASYYNISPLQAFKKLTGFLKSLGVKAVYDTSCSRDLSLIEACEEFVQRYRNPISKGKRQLPILASSCPGWICYAEKTLDADILPYISNVKSPQQVMGSIIKRFACHNIGVLPKDIFHVTIMPCYDKKLEAARDDFIFDVELEGNIEHDKLHLQLTEVDCVLTSGEMYDLIQAKGVDFVALKEEPLDRLLTNEDEEGHLYGVAGGSGGYAEFVFRYAATTLFDKHILGPLQFKTLRNSDFQEVKLEVDGQTVLQFARCYGFRNIQNLVRKLKSGKCEYHYVEVMACPSGCLNGGGQLKPKKGQSGKEMLQLLETIYLQEVNIRDPSENPIVKGLYKNWLSHPGSSKALEALYTFYHHREKSVTSQLSNW